MSGFTPKNTINGIVFIGWIFTEQENVHKNTRLLKSEKLQLFEPPHILEFEKRER